MVSEDEAGGIRMKLAAYQFAGSGSIDTNFAHIRQEIREAAACDAQICVFHECALTGYPPLECRTDEIDLDKADDCCVKVKKMAEEYRMFIFLGTVMRENDVIYNSVRVFSPSGTELLPYHKRALWGWDRDNFTEGYHPGIYEINGIKVGVRICFEIRFPEYFRELYSQKADLGIVCFCDTKNEENQERYDLIKGHIQTRAVENALPVLSVNNCANIQTAPTAFFDHHGLVCKEAARGRQELLVYDYIKYEEDFGTAGIRYVRDRLIK